MLTFTPLCFVIVSSVSRDILKRMGMSQIWNEMKQEYVSNVFLEELTLK